MELARDNNYSIADNTVLNVTSLMQCTDAQRLSLDEMSFGEFASTNVPTLLKGSRATVNGALFGPAPADGVPLYISNDAGSTFQDASAAPNGYTYYLCLIPGTDTATYALKACTSIYFNTEWRGWYETGTQNRVFGSCYKTAGSYPASYKRRIRFPELFETLIKQYSDGAEINARKLSVINKIGQVAQAYSATKQTEYGEGRTTLFKIRVDYPLTLQLVTVGKTWNEYSTVKTISGCSYVATMLDTDNASEIGSLPESLIENIPSSSSSDGTMKTLIHLPVGVWNIKLKTVIASYMADPSGMGNPTSFSYGLYVSTIYAYIRNVFGDRTGSWGAVL